MSNSRPSIDAWLEEIKREPGSENIGIVFLHVGVARGTTKDGNPVAGVEMTHDPDKVAEAVAEAEAIPGVLAARAWINEGLLDVGDDMVCALVAGNVRSNAFGAWEKLARRLKSEAMNYHER